MTGVHVIKLPPVYARSDLPINPTNLATIDDISAWPHLAGVHLPMLELSEVMLLIGQDCTEALIPIIDIIRGGKNEPWPAGPSSDGHSMAH